MRMKNKFLYVLSLPFIGIFYVVDFFFKIIDILLYPFKKIMEYECLGCYYTVYYLLFPFRFIFNKIGVSIYNLKTPKETKIDIEEIAPYEFVDESNNQQIQVEEENPEELNNEIIEAKPKKKELDIKNMEASEYLSALFADFYFAKKAKAKEEQEIKELIKQVKTENLRSEQPVAFKYVARDPDGKKISNIFVAHSKLEVLSYLSTEGYRVISINTSKLINFLYGPNSSAHYKLKNKDLIFWLTQLSTYIKSGIPLTQAMQILSKQMAKNAKKKRLFDSINYNLTLGESFSSALQKQGNSFPALLISMIKTAEATGELEETLDDMANYYTDIEETKKAMVSALMYPSIITVFSIGVVVFIMLYVIPQFEGIFESTGAEINSFTLFIMKASKFLEENIFKIVGAVVIVVIVIAYLFSKVKAVKKTMQEVLMKMPIFGKIIIYKEMSVFAKTFSSLLKNNVFITESMNLLSEVTSNEIYKEIMFSTVNNIAKGDKISKSFYHHWAVPDVAYYMIVTGESTGELATMMNKVAEYYATEHKAIINTMKSLIEPAMIIFLAVVVGSIVMAIILPMFGLYSQIS